MQDEISTDAELKGCGVSRGSVPDPTRDEPIDSGSASPNLIRMGCERITAEMVTLVDLNQSEVDAIVDTVPGGTANIQDIYPLSPLQEGMLFHRLLNDERDTYQLSTLFEVKPNIEVRDFVAAVQKVVDRHDILRSAILWKGLARPIQVVYRRAELPVEEFALVEDLDPIEQLKERMKPGAHPLDVGRAPLGRLMVSVKQCGQRWYAILRIHHLICDYQSLNAIAEETIAILEQREGELPASTAFRAHIAEALSRDDKERAEGFFRDKLGDICESTAPFGLANVHGDGSRTGEGRERLDPGLVNRVRHQAASLGVSTARLFHAAWALVIARTSGRDDVVYGTVLSSGRGRRAGAYRMLGMSVNTLPLRLRLCGVTASQLIRQTHQELAELVNWAQVPLTVAQSCSGMGGTAPLFTALLNYRHGAKDTGCDGAGARVIARGEAWANYPLALTVEDLGGEIELIAHTDRCIDPHRVLGYLSQALQSLVNALERSPQAQALRLSILPESERQDVVSLFNSTKIPYPQNALIHERYASQVARTPDAIAVMFDGQHLTYAELNGKANQLARLLKQKGIGPDRLVGICLDRGLSMVVGVLATLKAGGAYVPLDPTYPSERLAFMLQDAAPKVLLIQRRLRDSLKTTAEVVVLDDNLGEVREYAPSDSDAGEIGLGSENLAYVIYTSGSTGRPKGVMVQHCNVMCLWQGLERIHQYSAGSQRIALNASLNFDASVQQLVQLLSGKTLFIVPSRDRQDTSMLLRYLEDCQIESCDCTPSQLKSLVSLALLENKSLTIRSMLVGGEAIEPQLWKALARCSEIDFFNVYGPTECAVDASVARLTAESEIPHIGRPMENRSIYILDHQGDPAPIGVIGEIFIGGPGVGRGYFNQPEMTAERFVADPFSAEAHARMYRTGDLGRWRYDGTVEYLGRNDDQVKIRGFRIELGEIEAQLMRHPHVREAIVVVREDVPSMKRLVAYVVARTDMDPKTAPAITGLRTHLRATLPEYMVPSAFVLLDRLPLTPSGKLDRRALPAPAVESYTNVRYEAPRGEAEYLIAAIWEELLGIDQVGRNDNFFELGGHSLLIVHMMDKLRRVGLSADVRLVFESRTLANLAEGVMSKSVEPFDAPPSRIPVECEEITPQMLPLVALGTEQIERIASAIPGGMRNIKDIYPLAPLQEGLLFHHQLDERRGDTYTTVTLLSLSSRCVLERLIAALQSTMDRHDILRTAVMWEQLPQPVQVVCRRAVLPVETFEIDLRRNPLEQLKERMRPDLQRLDLREPPLMRLQVAADPQGTQWYALLQFHHIVSDHVTQEVFISEVLLHLKGREGELRDPTPYRNHVAQALAYASARDSEAFFRDRLKGIDETTAPFDVADVYEDGSRMSEASQQLEPRLAEAVRARARSLGVSVASLFHVAWGVVVARTTNRDDVVFGTVLLGRLQGGANATRALGMFINTLPLRLKLRGVTATEMIENTQRELVELLDHEHASLVTAQRCSDIRGNAPLFTSLLNCRHSAPNRDAEWEGAAGISALSVQDRTNYPITLSIDDRRDGFSLVAQTDPRVDARRLLGYVSTALRSLVEVLEHASDTPILALRILPEIELHQVTHSFCATTAGGPAPELIHELFERQVERSPHAVAAVIESQFLTYSELNDRANYLAIHLCSLGVEPDRLVGVCVERSLEMVVGIVAVLKAGGAYLPLDPAYPRERLAYVVRDAAPAVILTQVHLRARLPDIGAHVVLLDDVWSGMVQRPTTNINAVDLGLNSRNLAYVIYTSGSTGRPKGVMVAHGNVTRLFAASNAWFNFNERDVWTLFHSFAFDFSVWELWGALLYGGRVVIVPHLTARSTQEFRRLVCTEGVTVLSLTPSAFVQLMIIPAHGVDEHSLRAVIFGGEALELRKLRPWVKRNGAEKPQLVNMYGITETTVHVTYALLSQDEIESERGSVIGKPITDLGTYLLDRNYQPVPIGVAGELYVGGAGVSRGYLNRSALTAERFIPDPFNPDSHARLYRTGDLARWRSNGTLEYLGRNDHQVKIRGYRIELGEIEAQIARHERIKDVVVIAREDEIGEKRLVAYLVGDRRTARDDTSRGETPEQLSNDVVSGWETVFKETYEAAQAARGPSFIGWNSSYTGQPIPQAQMQEWLDGTIKRILALRPERVLEIGCGVGLLLQRLAPQCDAYVGTDLSAVALDQLRAWIRGRAEFKHVELFHRSGAELQDLKSGSFDTIVLNSVVQYFPDIEYLLAVLQEAVRLLSARGRIFVGDVRHLGTLPLLHSAIQLGKAAATVSVAQLRKRVVRAMAQEKELVINPQFFRVLPVKLPGISAVEVQLKRESSPNELTRHRYDVVLHMGESIGASPMYEAVEWPNNGTSAADLEELLRERRWSAVRLSSIPNARLAREAAAQRLIETSDPSLEAGILRRQLTELAVHGLDPDVCWRFGESHGYDVEVGWDPHSPECFQVRFLDRARADQVPRAETCPDVVEPWSAYATDPLEHIFRQQLIPQVREYLKERLPEYMVPSALLMLKELPLTPNGKIDRRALPAPQSRPEEMGEYVAPRTDLERAVAEIWTQILRVDQVGVEDNFFELGGHSLLATRVIASISHVLEVDLPLRVMFETPTVAGLCSYIVRALAAEMATEET